ncbi:Mitochondrial distribution and morphology protein 12 [Malassezia vespertilionis]|uniref:Mdm12p n=1 Tax=Malassezia vespertilionis TaxID=2020962 RepID=A0A2N1JF70_9BASI|nr:Mitochondrial distribution and morphology protein 12 [Malassezia vespertilionis]PKI85203.1 Mdm12p [Malassezia vespertilionis]WFD05849.1 Mitochondrial distribution and morphology protein 12 [Malassezia vespertilionis]
MSVDLDWSLLTQDLAEKLRERINELLPDVPLPDFVGPLHVHTLEFGHDPPEVELAHLGDVWTQFRDGVAAAHRAEVSLPPTSNAMPMRLRTFRHYEGEQPTSVNPDTEYTSEYGDDDSLCRWSETDSEPGHPVHASQCAETDEHNVSSENSLPSLQAHFRIQWLTTSIRVVLTTSLQMYHGGTKVMCLPMTLALTGMELLGQLILALDGGERCVHVCLAQDDAQLAEEGKTPERADPYVLLHMRHKAMRIIPYMAFDSRVGEPVKHVLQNVGKVERFAGDVLRQLLDTELVFPNFYTLYLP